MLHRKFPVTHIYGTSIDLVYKRFRIKKKVVVIKKFTNVKTKLRIGTQIKIAKDHLQEYM